MSLTCWLGESFREVVHQRKPSRRILALRVMYAGQKLHLSLKRLDVWHHLLHTVFHHQQFYHEQKKTMPTWRSNIPPRQTASPCLEHYEFFESRGNQAREGVEPPDLRYSHKLE